MTCSVLRSDDHPQQILLSRTDRLGDVILALPCVSLLKALFPEGRFSFLAQPYTAPIVRCFSLVDEVIEVGRHARSSHIAGLLSEKKFDAAIALYPAFNVACAFYRAKIPRRSGITYRWYSLLFNYRHSEHRSNNLKHEVEYNLSLTYATFRDAGRWEDVIAPPSLFPLPLKLPEAARQKVENLVHDKISGGRKIIAIHPGGSGSAHRWSESHYRELVHRLSSDDRIFVVITGGKGEETICKGVAGTAGGGVRNLCGELDLLELSALYQRCTLLIANSTGPLHLARALGTPVLGLFPSTAGMTPVRWGPYGQPQNVLMPPPQTDMEALTVEEVFHHAMVIEGENTKDSSLKDENSVTPTSTPYPRFI